MPWLKPLLFGYAAATALIGIAGFVSTGSLISMIAGVVSGILVAVGTVIADKKRMIGYGLCTLVALGLAFRFASGTFQGTIYPAGVMFALSVITLFGLGAGHFLAQRKA